MDELRTGSAERLLGLASHECQLLVPASRGILTNGKCLVLLVEGGTEGGRKEEKERKEGRKGRMQGRTEGRREASSEGLSSQAVRGDGQGREGGCVPSAAGRRPGTVLGSLSPGGKAGVGEEGGERQRHGAEGSGKGRRRAA